MKKELRLQMKNRLNSFASTEYKTASEQIAAKLYNQSYWKQSHTIGITISRGTEVHTKPIIKEAWQQGKRIVVPKCNPHTKEMTFRILHSFDQLEVVYYGLEEPIEEQTIPVFPNEIELLIVPGLAFNERGYRLGFGGGYYDRFLAKYEGHTLSLAFQNQIVSEIPIEDHDLPVEMIITNEKVLSCI